MSSLFLKIRYLHSGLVLSRKLDRSNNAAVQEANRYNLIESSAALLCSFVINLAVVAAFAAYFFDEDCAESGLACLPCIDLNGDASTAEECSGALCRAGSDQLSTCDAIGLERAGNALKKAAPNGELALIIWGVGLLAAGQAATMTATFAGQIVMEGFLDIKLPQWQRVLFTRLVALGPALFVSIATGSNTGLFNNINEWLNVLQSIQLPFAMLPVLKLTCMPSVMGNFCTQGRQALLVAALAFFVLFINFYLLVNFLFDPDAPVPHTAWFYIFCATYAIVYVAFLASLVWSEACGAADAALAWHRSINGRALERGEAIVFEVTAPLHTPGTITAHKELKSSSPLCGQLTS
jgi:natural resistance-associated macrophage protein 2